MQRKVLIISPTRREHEELPVWATGLDCELLFDEFAGSFFDDVLGRDGIEDAPEVVQLIEKTVRLYEGAGLSGVTSGVAYPGMPVAGGGGGGLRAAGRARRLGLRGPSVESVLLCEHKYYSRLAQHDLVPRATPDFGLIDPLNPRAPGGRKFPLFVKPVKSSFSMNARMVYGDEELRELVADGPMPGAYLKPFDDLLGSYTEFGAGGSNFIAHRR